MISMFTRTLKIALAGLLLMILASPSGVTPGLNFMVAASNETVIIGNDSGLNGDDFVSNQLPLGFSFSFFGQDISNAFLTTNGVLQFFADNSRPACHCENGELSNSGRNRSIFAFWDDLDTNGASKIRYATVGEAPHRKFVAQWTNMYFYRSPIQFGTFQAILYESTNVIQIQYRDIIGGERSQGNSATVGIKGNGSSHVNQYKANTLSPALQSGKAITFIPTSSIDTSTYQLETSRPYDNIFLSVSGSPSLPTLSSPLDEAIDVNREPTLEWGSSTDATSYTLLVSRSSNFSTMLNGDFPKQVTGTSYTFSDELLASTSYYWRVIARNNIGEISSAAHTFTTQAENVSPENITDISGDLRNGLEVSAGSLSGKSISFRLSDPDTSQFVRYQIQISRNADFSETIVEFRSNLSDQGQQTYAVGTEAGTYTIGDAGTQFSPGSYFMRIQNEDAQGSASAWTELGNPAFTILDVPSPPVIEAPTSPTNLVTIISAEEVTLTWRTPNNSASGASVNYVATLTSSLETLSCETTNLSCTINGVHVGVSYQGTVVAINSGGHSPASNAVDVFIPDLNSDTNGTTIPTTFESTANHIGLSPLNKVLQDRLISFGIVDAPSNTIKIGVTNDLSNNKFDVETLMTDQKAMLPGSAIGIKLTPPSDTPIGTLSFAYVQIPDSTWIFLGSAPAVANVLVSLPPMSFVVPGSYKLLLTLVPPTSYTPAAFLRNFNPQPAFAVSADPSVGIHTVRLGVVVAKGSAPLPTLIAVKPEFSATPIASQSPATAPTEAAPTEPAPTEPAPTEPAPVEAAPAKPTTSKPANVAAPPEIVAYSPMDDPAGVAGTVVTALALAAAAGATGRSGSGKKSQAEAQESTDGGSVSTVDVQLRGFKSTESGVGDQLAIVSASWFSFMDKPTHNAAVATSKFSPLLSTLISDGAYLRALLGSLTIPLAIVAIGTGFTSAISLEGAILPPSAVTVGVIAMLGVFDSLAGFLGMLTFIATALALGQEHTAADVRMLMGVMLIGFGPILLANGARKFRREKMQSFEDVWERAIDLAVGSFLAGWSVLAMVSVLPALAGLTLPIANSAKSIGLLIGGATVLRILLEEATVRYVPTRLNRIHPTEVPDSSVLQKIFAITVRASVFMFVSVAFIGFEWYLFAGTLLFVIPSLIALKSDRFPNYPILYQIIPSGIPGLIFSLVVGASTVKIINSFVGDDPKLAKLAFVLVPLPLLTVAILSMFGREPKSNDVRWYLRPSLRNLYRVGGTIAFLLVLHLTGIVGNS
jgi:hypothetical protein